MADEMDSLSVASSIAGLLALMGKIVAELSTFTSAVTNAPLVATRILNETRSLASIFNQLQRLLVNNISARHARAEMVSVDQLVVMLTGCVITFSELESELDSVGTANEARLWDVAGWAQSGETLRRLVERLAVHKASWSLMLTMLLCHPSSDAEKTIEELRVQVDKLAKTNERLLALVQGSVEESHSGEPRRDSHCTTMVGELQSAINPARSEVLEPFRFGFEDTLYRTRVYAGTPSMMSVNSAEVSFTSTHTFGTCWTHPPGVSLAQHSDIAGVRLPISPNDIRNSIHWFTAPAPNSQRNPGAGPSGLATIPSHLPQSSRAGGQNGKDNDDAATIRGVRRSTSRGAGPVSQAAPQAPQPAPARSYSLPANFNIEEERKNPFRVLESQFRTYLTQSNPSEHRPTPNARRFLVLPPEHIDLVAHSVSQEIHRREGNNQDAALPGDNATRALLATLPDQRFFDMIGDLLAALEQRRELPAHDILRAPVEYQPGILLPESPRLPSSPNGSRLRVDPIPSSPLPPPPPPPPPPKGLGINMKSPPTQPGVRGHPDLSGAVSKTRANITHLPPLTRPLTMPMATTSWAAHSPKILKSPRLLEKRLTVSILGETCTGKSELLCPSELAFMPTIEDHSIRQLAAEGVTLDIIDTGGSSVYHTLIPRWIEESQLLLLVYRADLPGSWEFIVAIVNKMKKKESEKRAAAVVRASRPSMIFEDRCGRDGQTKKNAKSILIFENKRGVLPTELYSEETEKCRRWAEQHGCGFAVGDSSDELMADRLFLMMVRARKAVLVGEEKKDVVSGIEVDRKATTTPTSPTPGQWISALQRRISRDWLRAGKKDT